MATPIPQNRVVLDARAVAEATGGAIVRATPGRSAQGITTDTRALSPRSAFVALRGETHDGHRFVPAAIDAGAVLVVVERGHARALDDARADVVEVDDTLVAWGAIARRHLRAWRGTEATRRVVGVTGSAGKTTTKELTAALLRRVGPCLATPGNLNNRIGLPAVALEVDADHRYVVLEMGMSVPGEIAALTEIAAPDVGVIVNVGMAHAGGVGGTLEGVAAEKGALFAGLRPGGVAVANADDAAVMAHAGRAAHARVVTFGRSDRADVRLVARDADGVASRATVDRAGRRSSFIVPLPGEAACIDLVAALAAAEAAAGPIDDADVALALSGLGSIPGRMNVLRCDGVTIIDDAYNANPASMRAALSVLGEMPASRHVAVLGEMKELGPAALSEHERLADAVVAARVGLLISCGGLADAIALAVEKRGVEVALAQDADGAARIACERLRRGDAVLVKASRSVGAERVVAALERIGRLPGGGPGA